jgi:hypothetical protein
MGRQQVVGFRKNVHRAGHVQRLNPIKHDKSNFHLHLRHIGGSHLCCVVVRAIEFQWGSPAKTCRTAVDACSEVYAKESREEAASPERWYLFPL